MGCKQSQQQEENQELMYSSSRMKNSINQEIPIQVPRRTMEIKCLQNQKTTMWANMPSIEIQSSEPFIIGSTPPKTSKQQITLENILTVMNGQTDSVIEYRKGKKKSKRRSKPHRISMEQLEELF